MYIALIFLGAPEFAADFWLARGDLWLRARNEYISFADPFGMIRGGAVCYKFDVIVPAVLRRAPREIRAV